MKRIFILIFALSLTFCFFSQLSAFSDEIWSSYQRQKSLYVLAPDDAKIEIGSTRSTVESVIGTPSESLEYVAPSITDNDMYPIDFGSLYQTTNPLCSVAYDGMSIAYDCNAACSFQSDMQTALSDTYGINFMRGASSYFSDKTNDERVSTLSDMLAFVTPYCESAYVAFMNDAVVSSIEITSPKYRLFNGLYVGQSVDEYVTILNTGARMFYDDSAYYYRTGDEPFLLLDTTYFLNNRNVFSDNDTVYVIDIETDDKRWYIESIRIYPYRFL